MHSGAKLLRVLSINSSIAIFVPGSFAFKTSSTGFIKFFEFGRGMPIWFARQPTVDTWGVAIGACRLHNQAFVGTASTTAGWLRRISPIRMRKRAAMKAALLRSL
jgi:hypothetical protein